VVIAWNTPARSEGSLLEQGLSQRGRSPLWKDSLPGGKRYRDGASGSKLGKATYIPAIGHGSKKNKEASRDREACITLVKS